MSTFTKKLSVLSKWYTSTHLWYDKTMTGLYSDDEIVSMIKKFEWYGIFYLSWTHGFELPGKQPRKLSKLYHFINCLSHLWFLIVISRSFLLIQRPSESLFILFGDVFAGKTDSDFYHSLLMVLTFDIYASRVVTHISGRKNTLKALRMFSQLITYKLNPKRLLLTKKATEKFKRSLYWNFQFFFTTPPAIAVLYFLILFFFAVQSPYFLSSIGNMAWFTLIIILIVVPHSYNLVNLFWYFIVILSSMNYSDLALATLIEEAVDLTNDLENRENRTKQVDKLITYVLKLDEVLDFIDDVNDDYRYIAFLGYIVTTLTADFTLFLAIFINGNSLIITMVLLALSITAMGVDSLLFYLSCLSNKKISQIRTLNYKINALGMKYKKMQAPLACLLNVTEDRFEEATMGFTVAQLFVITQETFLIFALENAGIFLMFCSNFVKF